MKDHSLDSLHKEILSCHRCFEAGYLITPGAIFSSGSQPRVMIIGQAPGITEVAAKRPFNAGSGRRLFQWLGEAGWQEDEFRKRHYMTAVTKCYPGKNNSGRGDRVPSKVEQQLCRPFLEQEIAVINPRLIIPVGGLAIKQFYPSRAKLNEVIGSAAYFPPESIDPPLCFEIKPATLLNEYDRRLPRAGRWLVPLPHPSGASLWPNQPESKALIDRAVKILAGIRESWEL